MNETEDPRSMQPFLAKTSLLISANRFPLNRGSNKTFVNKPGRDPANKKDYMGYNLNKRYESTLYKNVKEDLEVNTFKVKVLN